MWGRQRLLLICKLVPAPLCISRTQWLMNDSVSGKDWNALIAEIVFNLKEDAVNEIFYDEHIYKLVAVVLECLEMRMIDEELAYRAIWKAAEQPLVIRGISREIKEQRQLQKDNVNGTGT